MELTGELVDDYEIVENPSLKEILSWGIVEEALFPAGQEIFPSVRENVLECIGQKQALIRGSLEKLARETPLPFQVRDFNLTKDKLIESYFSEEMGMHFDKLSPALFDIKRVIPYEVEKRHENSEEIQLQIPLFASVGLGETEFVSKEAYDTDLRRYEFKIRSFAPPITREAKGRIKSFQSFYMGALSKALNEPIIGDILLRDLVSGNALPQIKMFWIPRAEDLRIEEEVIDKDPFVAAKVYGTNYLVAQWDVSGEMPYQHYLNELGLNKKPS